MSTKRASKARLVITAITLEGRTVAEMVADYAVSRSWVYELLTCYGTEGETAFEPRSRRPRSSPNATPSTVVDLILQIRTDLADRGLDAGAETIGWHLIHRHQVTVSRATIHRILARSAAVVPDPSKRPKSSYLRSRQRCRTRPGSPTSPTTDWSDLTVGRAPMWRSSAGSTTTPATHSMSPHTGPSPPRQSSRPSSKPLTCTDTPHPRSPTTAWSTPSELSGRPRRRQEGLGNRAPTTRHRPEELPTITAHDLRQGREIPADHEQVATRPTRPADHPDPLQTVLDTFLEEYNHRRPHRSLPHRATPATAYMARPKATPTGDRSTDSHDRTRHDIVSSAGNITLRIAGQLRHIGVSRTYARTRVILLINDLHVRIVDAAAGELIRELIVDPSKDYQPLTPPPKTRK